MKMPSTGLASVWETTGSSKVTKCWFICNDGKMIYFKELGTGRHVTSVAAFRFLEIVEFREPKVVKRSKGFRPEDLLDEDWQ
jgi:hypothetical protein